MTKIVVYEGRSKSSRPDLVLFKIKLNTKNIKRTNFDVNSGQEEDCLVCGYWKRRQSRHRRSRCFTNQLLANGRLLSLDQVWWRRETLGTRYSNMPDTRVLHLLLMVNFLPPPSPYTPQPLRKLAGFACSKGTWSDYNLSVYGLKSTH